ncbi:MAG: hypothetical protein ACE5Q3_15255, partial [Alphaproteobacteria bacterium]
MKRAIFVVVVLIVLVVAAGLFFVFSSLDSVVKAAVEKVGSDATGTQVTLGEVEISPISGKGTLRQFRMTNPEGFEPGDTFKFELVSVTIDVLSLLRDPVVIEEIVIAAPELTYAISGDSTNVDEIQKNVDSYAGSGDGTRAGNGGDGDDEGRRVVIENLYLRDGTIVVTAPGITGRSLSATLPDIHLTDIGKDGAGATPGEAAKQAMASVVASTKMAIEGLDLGQVLQKAEETAGEAKESLEGAAKDAESAVEEATE